MYRKVVFFGLVLALAVMVAGSLARLLGIFDAVPAQALHIRGAYALSAVIVVILILSWWQVQCRVAAMTTAFGATVLLGLQVGLGIVILKTPDHHAQLLTGHLFLGATLIWVLFWLYLRSGRDLPRLADSKGPVLFARISMFLLLLQIALGSWVSVNHATMACAGFPQCNGQWWPKADYVGFLNSLLAGNSLSVEIQIAANWLHRVGALLCFVVFNILVMRALASSTKNVRKAALWLSFLLFAQVALGVIGHKFAMPLWVVVAHTVVAALLMLPLIAISFYSRYGYAESQPALKEPLPEPAVIEAKQIPTETIAPSPVIPEAVSIPLEEPYLEPAPESVYQRLKSQLARTRTGLGSILANLPLGQKANEDLLEEIESSLLMADVGIDVTTKIINRLTQSLERQQLNDSDALTSALKQELLSILAPCSQPLQIPKQDKPFVILVVGVNGVGKTTTIGKLAKRLKAQGHSVMLAAGDTFRAAAVEQLQTWGQRNDIHVVAQHTGADSASVIYDGIQSAQSKGR